jgi:glycosyltransferase involved in cell wall biosynthesis
VSPEPQPSPDRSGVPSLAGVALAPGAPVVLVAARNEADRVGQTLVALVAAFPGALLVVADDSSTDATAEVAAANGALVVGGEPGARPLGKGGNVGRAASSVLELASREREPVFLLCDADLGPSATALRGLVEHVAAGRSDVAIAAFARRVGGGFGFALGYAHRAIERLCGYDAGAPISGQRALSSAAFRAVVPFAAGYGMEIGITVDAVRAGMSVSELELPLEHRATGKSLAGFAHRARQLRDFRRVYRSRQG